MMSVLGHVQMNINPENISFYRELMEYLGWSTIHADDTIYGAGNNNGSSLWFLPATRDTSNDYDGYGVNHLAFAAGSPAEVDAAVGFLNDRGIPCLFETPRHRPEFAMDETQTYYQVMFESPDHLLFEVVYTGPKA